MGPRSGSLNVLRCSRAWCSMLVPAEPRANMKSIFRGQLYTRVLFSSHCFHETLFMLRWLTLSPGTAPVPVKQVRIWPHTHPSIEASLWMLNYCLIADLFVIIDHHTSRLHASFHWLVSLFTVLIKLLALYLILKLGFISRAAFRFRKGWKVSPRNALIILMIVSSISFVLWDVNLTITYFVFRKLGLT